MHETVDDPLLRLIEWHSNITPSQPSDPTPSLDGEAIEAALREWHASSTSRDLGREATAS
jgi:hypothetical protein